jgi:hypothetical protein
MSSSKGETSKKLSWAKSMDAKLNHENRLWEAALKQTEGGKTNITLPTVKNEKQKPANVKLFDTYLEEAKVELKRRQEKNNKKQQQKKEEKANGN